MLTGHGRFDEYLQRIGKEPITAFHYCDAEVDSYTVEKCSAWTEEGALLAGTIGKDFSLSAKCEIVHL